MPAEQSREWTLALSWTLFPPPKLKSPQVQLYADEALEKRLGKVVAAPLEGPIGGRENGLCRRSCCA